MATVRRFKCDVHGNPVLWPKSSLITERKPVALSRWIALRSFCVKDGSSRRTLREERELVPKLSTEVKGVFLIESWIMKKGSVTRQCHVQQNKITTSLLDCLIGDGNHLILYAIIRLFNISFFLYTINNKYNK
jgi:hypothetical protein